MELIPQLLFYILGRGEVFILTSLSIDDIPQTIPKIPSLDQ